MQIKCYHEFKSDQDRSLFIRDDNQSVTCNSAASLSTAIGCAEFSLVERIKFLWIDFLALIPFFRGKQFTVLNERLMPTLIEKIEKANQFVRENYDCVAKNVDCLQDAKITCFGENHFQNHHRIKNAVVIDELAGKNTSDIILVEETNQEWAKKSAQAQYVKKPIPRKGWDNRDDPRFERLASLTEIAEAAINFMVLSNFIVLVNFYHHNDNKLMKYAFDTNDLVYLIYNLGLILPAIIISHNYERLLTDTFVSSNQSMCKTIQESLKYRKINVMAGIRHLFYTGSNTERIEAVNILRNYLNKHKHIILIPKPIGLEKIRRYIMG